MDKRKIKKTTLFVAVIIFAVITVFSVVNKHLGKEKTVATIYQLSSDKMSIVETKSEFYSENRDELYKEIAEELIKNPKTATENAKKTIVNNVAFYDGGITVDFSEEYANANVLTTYAVIKTFCQLTEVNRVLVLCNGRDVLGSGFVQGDKINFEFDDDCTRGVRLYFLNEAKNALSGEYRKISITDTQPIEQDIVTEMIKGPKAEKNRKLLPGDMGVISVETTDGVCYVNLHNGFGDKNTDNKMQELMVYSIVNSLTELEEVNSVQFLIEGKKAEKIGEIDFSVPLERNEALIGE